MKRAFLICFLASAFLAGIAAPDAAADASSNQLQKDLVVNKIKTSLPVPINVANSHQSPLFIQEASVKEISADDFTMLVGEPSSYFRQTTFPDVTLLNVAAKTIKSFAIVVESAVTKKGYVTISPTLSITPGSIYNVSGSHWVKAERISVQKGGTFVSVLQQPGLDSAKSWIPGAATDLKVALGFVVFEDGTKWTAP
jgi:hypothetical protein